VESPFRGVTNSRLRFDCRRKNVDNKPWHDILTSLRPKIVSQAQRLTPYPPPSLFSYRLHSPASSSITSSTVMMRDKKKRVDRLLQRPYNIHVPCVVHSPSVPASGTVPVSTLMPGMMPFALSISTIVWPLLAFW